MRSVICLEATAACGARCGQVAVRIHVGVVRGRVVFYFVLDELETGQSYGAHGGGKGK